ncbi:unnamed protein product [Pylaiella littoralis]
MTRAVSLLTLVMTLGSIAASCHAHKNDGKEGDKHGGDGDHSSRGDGGHQVSTDHQQHRNTRGLHHRHGHSHHGGHHHHGKHGRRHGKGAAVLTRRGRIAPGRPVSVRCSPPVKESLFVVDLCECEGSGCEDGDYCGEFVATLGNDVPCIMMTDDAECDFELVVPEEVRWCGEGSAGRQFRIRVTDENDDSYLSCSPPIEVASEEEDEEEEELSPCVIENVPLSSDDETGRNDDGTDCEWVGTTSSDDDEDDCVYLVEPEHQCGGCDYKGSTCCTPGYECMEMGVDYYECCLEGIDFKKMNQPPPPSRPQGGD